MADQAKYLSIASSSIGLYKEKRNKFLSFIYPINSADEIKAILNLLRKEHHAARHICYAYIINPLKPEKRSNNAGEPANTAGKPLLSLIENRNLIDILIVVVRYFGGTKLGLGGLTRAYKSAAEDALNNALIIKYELQNLMHISFNYIQLNDVMHIVALYKLQIVQQDFHLNPSIIIKVKTDDIDKVTAAFKRVNNITISIDK